MYIRDATIYQCINTHLGCIDILDIMIILYRRIIIKLYTYIHTTDAVVVHYSCEFYSSATIVTYVCTFYVNSHVLAFISIVPTITTHSPNIGILSGENVTFECLSSDPNIELFWTYQTNRSSNTITIDNITETRFLSDSSLLHRLTLPSANVSDEGVYRCIAQQPFSSIATETIVLNVLPGE